MLFTAWQSFIDKNDCSKVTGAPPAMLAAQ
jgi:hypothetical protein